MTLSMSRVIRSSVGRPSVSIAVASAAVRSISAADACPALGTRVLEPVGVALVAVERRGRRVELEDRFPEPVGEVVDRRQGGVGKGHAVGLLCSAPGSWRSDWGAAVDAVA